MKDFFRHSKFAFYITVIVIFSLVSSCKKDKTPKNHMELESLKGTWDWYYTLNMGLAAPYITWADSSDYQIKRIFSDDHIFKEFSNDNQIFEGEYYVTIEKIISGDTIFRIHYFEDDEPVIEDLFFYLHPDTIHFGYQTENDIVFVKR